MSYQSQNELQCHINMKKIESVLSKVGYINLHKISDTLQGGVWSGIQQNDNRVIKVTNKYLHKNGMATSGNKTYHRIDENILSEQAILEYLTKQDDAPKSIVKYHHFFKSNHYYFLVQENGGRSLFDFVLKAHQLISSGTIAINEWHKVIKCIFIQMIESIEYIHKHKVSHFDISLENFLINDIQVQETKNTANQSAKISFYLNDLQIKLCDFGLAEYFEENDDFLNNKWCGKPNYQCPEINDKLVFSARYNDIFCLGVCLFMMTIGNAPWKYAHKKDELFMNIISGHIADILKSWNKIDYVDQDWMDLIQSIFQYEKQRINLDKIKKHSWLKQ